MHWTPGCGRARFPVPAAATRIDRAEVPSAQESDALLDVRDLKTEFQVGTRTYKAVGGVSFHVAPASAWGLSGSRAPASR